MKNSKLLLALSLLTFLSSASFAANVTKVSGETFEQVQRNAYWVVSVSCDDGSEKRTVRRNADADAWCPKGGSNLLCSDDKSVAAKNACSPQYKSELIAKAQAGAQEQQARQAEANRQKQAAERANRQAEIALQAKISIAEELVSIEQRRLELVQSELKINRRLVEIEEILKTEGDEEEEDI